MVELKSDEEKHFNEWCLELKEKGFISKVIYEPKALKLSDPVKRDYIKQLKKSQKLEKEHLLHGHEYTYDFDIHWTMKAIGVFIALDAMKKTSLFIGDKIPGVNEYVTAIEIKGGFDRNNMTRLVMLNIKWAYKDLGVFVNLVKIPDYFKKTFYPKSLLITKAGKPRKLKFNPISLEEFLNK